MMLRRNEIKARLKGVDSNSSVAFAFRCSLRVLPLLVADNQNKHSPWYWTNDYHYSTDLLTLFRIQQAGLNIFFSIENQKSSKFDKSILSEAGGGIASYIDRSLLTSYDDALSFLNNLTSRNFLNTLNTRNPQNPADTAVSYAVHAVISASASAIADSNLDSRSYAVDAAFATLAAAAHLGFSSSAHNINLKSEVLFDLDNIFNNDFIFSPLWSESIPKNWTFFYKKFNDSLIALDEGFEIWVKWYKDRLDSLPIDLDLENKWLTIPVEITQQGVKATNAYFSSLVVDHQLNSMRPLNLVRAIFIGNGAAGKTSLIRRLHNEHVLEGKEEMTPGIQIREWPVDPQTNIKARFWDFGGQVMSHSTHQFFLRERCLYVLVVDAGSEHEIRENQTANDQAEYWLEHVKAFGNSAPVMIVGNKSDLTTVNLDMNALRESYPNIVDFYPVSCTCLNSRYISRFNLFRDDLSEELKAVGTHQVMFTPNQFVVLKQIQLLSRKNAFLGYDEFDSLCQKYEIGKVGLDQQAFLGVLDSLGEVIHFPELEWSDAYVLNPRWLTYGVYTLLYSEKAKRQQGVLSDKDVVSILQAETVMDENGNKLTYPREKCRFIIDAMSDFKLCYCLPKDSCYFVIPDKLPKKQPDLSAYFDKHGEGTLAFEFYFSGFLPRNIMPNLIVSKHREIMKNKVQFSTQGRKTSFLGNLGRMISGRAATIPAGAIYQSEQLVWQRGVILHNQTYKSTACLQVDYHKRILKLWVQGHQAREYLVILRDEIYNILNRIKGLSVTEKLILPEFARIPNEIAGFASGEIEKAPHNRLLKEAMLGKQITVSDAGNQYDLMKVMGFIMTEKQQSKAGVNITYNIGTAGAVGGAGDHHQVSGQVINVSDKQLVGEFQDSIAILMEYIEKLDSDFKTKSLAYNELQQINSHLGNIENASPETNSKLQQFLRDIKDGSLGALQLVKDVKDCDETVVWLMEKAALLSALLASPIG